MSDPATTADRQLEEDFRPVLRAALAAAVALRCSHEDLPEDGSPRPLPMVGIAARSTGKTWALTDSNGDPAELMELRFECRVDGALPQSADTLKNLVALVEAAVEGADASSFPAWDVLDGLERTGTGDGWDGGTRTAELTYILTALRTV